MRGGLNDREVRASLEDYVSAKAVVTIIDGDDWVWIYVGNDLVSEGHDDLNGNAFIPVMNAILGEDNWIYQREWVSDQDVVESMCFNAQNLPDIQEKFGYEPNDILIYW